ncbi:type II secretion system protein [Photobacterium sp. GB-36]|nr:prepilin-type N-terminal cleavage/methylation domain-containing protein [Photobacterium sp. GB-36]PSV41191.1 hypothetical protein C9J46_19425 [Photobacterium sp. GB-36]
MKIKGFTLLESIITISVLSILIAMAATQQSVLINKTAILILTTALRQ